MTGASLWYLRYRRRIGWMRRRSFSSSRVSSKTLKSWMYALSRRIRAISTFSFDTGMSTRRCPAWQALRTRVSMSATGSVRFLLGSRPGPAGLAHAGDFAAEGELPEADATQLELAQRAATATAALAAVVAAHLELRRSLDLLDPALLRHAISSGHRDRGLAPERHAQFLEQRQRGVVAPGAGHEGDVHPVDALDFVVVDLGEDHLLLEADRVV